jgi:hypothetical protein
VAGGRPLGRKLRFTIDYKNGSNRARAGQRAVFAAPPGRMRGIDRELAAAGPAAAIDTHQNLP